MPTVIIWGAGKIGRGLAADIFNRAGWHIIFIRRSRDFVAHMRQAGRYAVLHAEQGPEQLPTIITGYEAYSTDEVMAIADAVVRADLIVVPVMAPQLASVAPQLVPGLLQRRAARPGDALDILTCANMVNSALHLRTALRQALPATVLSYLDKRIGIVETLAQSGATDASAEERARDPAIIYISGPSELQVDQGAFRGPIPAVPGLKLVHDPGTASMVKIWHGNMAHSSIAYHGWLQGYTLMYRCVQDPAVVAAVTGAMNEAGAALLANGRVTQGYLDQSLVDFFGPAMLADTHDTVSRVAADPLRKLGREDRLIGPLLLARRHALPFTYLARAVACALRYDNAEDPQAVRLQERLRALGLRATVFEVCGLKTDESDVVEAIMHEYNSLTCSWPTRSHP